MKYLVIARHGYYDFRTGDLNERGRKKIEKLTEELKKSVDKRVVIISSTAPRAIQSAEVIREELGGELYQEELLYSDKKKDPDCPTVFQLIEGKEKEAEVEVLILVTHYEYTEDLHLYFFKRKWNITLGGGILQRGEAWLISYDKRSIECLYA